VKTSGLLPWPTPEELNPEQREFYDTVVSSPRAAARPTPLTDEEGRLYRPFNAMLTNPALRDAMQAIGIAQRFSGKLSRPLFEALVLMVAVKRHPSYEWYARPDPAAPRRDGGPARRDPRKPLARDGRPARPGRRSTGPRDTLAHVQPSEKVVSAVEEEFGGVGVNEVVVTITNYDAIAVLMRTWDAQLPEGVADPLA